MRKIVSPSLGEKSPKIVRKKKKSPKSPKKTSPKNSKKINDKKFSSVTVSGFTFKASFIMVH